MSTDTLAQRRAPIANNRKYTGQLLDAAAKDTDAVSVFCDGTNMDDTEAAIFVVKGREHIDYLRALCQRQGLLTEGKAVDS